MLQQRLAGVSTLSAAPPPADAAVLLVDGELCQEQECVSTRRGDDRPVLAAVRWADGCVALACCCSAARVMVVQANKQVSVPRGNRHGLRVLLCGGSAAGGCTEPVCVCDLACRQLAKEDLQAAPSHMGQRGRLSPGSEQTFHSPGNPLINTLPALHQSPDTCNLPEPHSRDPTSRDGPSAAAPRRPCCAPRPAAGAAAAAAAG